MAQFGQLQLNLLLEPDQTLEWVREYPVYVAEGISADIILGKLTDENTLIGILKTEGTGDRLVLHGIQSKNRYILREWLDNSIETGSLRLQYKQDSVWGHWFNEPKSLRLDIKSIPRGSGRLLDELRQYQYGDFIFFTRLSEEKETVLKNFWIDSTVWEAKYMPYKRCYDVQVGSKDHEFCRTGELGLYYYSHVDIVRIIHGFVPQIPHDATFNFQITQWLSDWANEIASDSEWHMADQRWSKRQAIWFIPDYITDDVVSGLLSIQHSGDSSLHARSMIYDRKKNIFYQPEDFFRSNTRWNEEFQKTAERYIYQRYNEIIDVFPEIMDHVEYHMTINPAGLVISTDFTPYFGRLDVQLDKDEYEDDLQRFTPFRKLLLD